MAENRLLSDVTEALRNGETVKARELLIRLITAEPTVADYWVWLSSVAATTEDEISYLRQALHLDPRHPDARARLAALGVDLPVLPVNPFPTETGKAAATAPAAPRTIPGLAWLRRQPRSVVAAVLWVGAFVVVVAGFGLGLTRRPERMPLPGTAVPSSTYLPTNSPVVRSPTPTYVGPKPLWMRLEATYTPTPVYVQTPHPRSEAYQVGMRRYQQGDLPGLVEYMDQVIFNEPDAADAAYYAGEGWRLQGEFDKALGYYEQAITTNPNFAPAYLGRARAQIALDPLADVQADVDQALTLDPGFFETYLFAAEVALGRDDGNTALNMLAQAEQRSGVSPALLLLRARARLATGEIALALQDAQEVNRLDITMIPAYQTLAQIYQANDQPAESIEPWHTYLLYRAEDLAAWLSLAAAQHDVGDDDSALDSLETVLATDPEQAGAYLLRAEIRLDSAEDGSRKEAAQLALDDLTQATVYSGDPFRLALAKGRATLALEMPDLALNHLNRAAGLVVSEEDWGRVYYWRAQALTALKRPADAAQDWQSLLALPAGTIPDEWRAQAEQSIAP